MSLLKANAVQLGQSLTASQNFTWYQPSTPDGTVRLGNGNSGSVTDLVTLTSAGNLGIGTSSPGTKVDIGSGTLRIKNATGDTSGLLIYQAASDTSTIFNYYSGPLVFGTGNAERMRLDSSGNLGLGVTPSAWGSTFKALQEGAGSLWSYSSSGFGFTANAYNNSGWKYVNNGYANSFETDTGKFIWYTAPSGTAGNAISFTQAMTLDASGALSNVAYVKAGTYLWAAGDTSSGGIYLGSAGANNARIGQNSFGTGTTTTYIGNAAITTSSDVRLKENIEDTKRNAIEILGNLRVVDHTWNDPTDTCENNRNSRGVWMGLIAQEAINHIPWLVNKPLSDEDERGNPQYWHMDYGYSVPLLVKAIQELSAELNELKQKVNA